MSTLVSVNQAAAQLGVTSSEVIDAAGLTLGELEHAAVIDGFDASQYRQVPAIDANHLEVIATRLDSSSAVVIECAACGRELGTVSSAPPVPVKCYGCKTSPGNAKAGPASPATAFDI